jgi:signal transduction histidine kinase
LRLADFIDSNIEPILHEWENFARTLKPAATNMTDKELRNHAALMLEFVARDLRSSQSVRQQIDKSHGEGPGEHDDAGHGLARMESNFTIEQLVSEYRALRSSVLRLFAESLPLDCSTDVGDVIRFDESIDQLLAASVFSFAAAKRKADELEENRRSQFLAMLGHELRNPLSPISSAAAILKQAKGVNPVVDTVSNVLTRQVAHMASLVDDLLDVSRVTRGMIEIKLEIVDLRHAISDAVEQITPQVAARRQKLIVKNPTVPAVVQADKKRIVQIVTNLLSNAAKYTPEGGNLAVSITVCEHDVVILVEDDGMGMAPDFIPQAFELFAQATRTSDRAEGGLGLGLALVKNLVELHGGQVTCKSEGLGKGSQFTVRLPRPQSPELAF